MALVGGGEHPKYLTNKVIIWDENKKKVISELKFSTEVKSVRMRKDKYVLFIISIELLSFANKKFSFLTLINFKI